MFDLQNTSDIIRHSVSDAIKLIMKRKYRKYRKEHTSDMYMFLELVKYREQNIRAFS